MLRRSDTKHGKDKYALIFHAEVQPNLFKVNANRAQDKINADLFLRSEGSGGLRKTTLYEAEEKQVCAYFSCRGAA